MNDTENQLKPWQKKIHEIIYEADTPAGKLFDILLIVFIVLSVVAVMLESVSEIEESIGPFLHVCEWIFTIAFTIEYILRIISIKKKKGSGVLLWDQAVERAIQKSSPLPLAKDGSVVTVLELVFRPTEVDAGDQ